MTGPEVTQHQIGTGPLRATVLNIGAAVQDMRLEGFGALVLGYADPRAYLDNPYYLGAVVGRVANRIAGGQVEIDGRTYDLDRNTAHGHMLHGGPCGLATRRWDIADLSDQHVTLHDVLPDGHMGFPGRLEVVVTYRVDGTRFTIDLHAQSDAPTLCNLAPHSYWALGARGVDDLTLTVQADHILPTDSSGVPTGDIAAVAATRLDLRRPKPLRGVGAVDHNYCLTGSGLRPVATLSAPGVSLHIETDAPGLQVYTGDHLDHRGAHPLPGQPHAPRAGIALEPQHWPDAPHHAGFGSILLRPGETFRQRSHWTLTPQT